MRSAYQLLFATALSAQFIYEADSLRFSLSWKQIDCLDILVLHEKKNLLNGEAHVEQIFEFAN